MKPAGAAQSGMGAVADRFLVAHGFGGHYARLVGSADRPASDSDLGAVMDVIEVDQIPAFGPVDLSEVAGMEAVVACIPIIEGVIVPGEIGIVEVSGAEEVVEGGELVGGEVPHGHDVAVADEQK